MTAATKSAREALKEITKRGNPTVLVAFADYGAGTDKVFVCCSGSPGDVAALAEDGNKALANLLHQASLKK